MDLPLNLSYPPGNVASGYFKGKPYQLYSVTSNDCRYSMPTASNSALDSVIIAPIHLISEQDSVDNFSYFLTPISSVLPQVCGSLYDTPAPKPNSEAESQLCVPPFSSPDMINNDERSVDFFSYDLFSPPQAKASVSCMPSDYPCVASSSYNDYELERENSSSTLSALVNKLLDEPDGEESKSEPEGWWHDKNDSIGELAIKLANIGILDENDNIVDTTKSNMAPETSPSDAKAVEEEKTFVGLNHRNKAAERMLGFVPSQNPTKSYVSRIKEGSGVADKRTPVGYDNQRKRIMSSKPPYTGQQLAQMKRGEVKPRNIRKAAVDMKQSNMNNAGEGAAIVHPFSFSGRAKPPASFSKKLSGPPVWVQFPAAKTGSVSSCDSSLYREPIQQFASWPKYKGFSKSKDFGENSIKLNRRPRPPRKTFISCSSESQRKFSECVFCKTNGEAAATYRSHVLKDEHGRTLCEVLQKYVCPLCGATGFNAHTLKYCPKNENPPAIATMTTLKGMRSSTGRKRYGLCSGQVHRLPFDSRHGLFPA